MNLEGDKRLNLQLRLDFSSAPTGETRQAGRGDIESPSAVSEPERPANTRRIMEEVCERANLKEALRQVRSNKASAGVDGMTVDQLGHYLKQHWPAIRDQLLNGSYEPKPVHRVEIPKPDAGGMRKLGISTVLDRFIQQAVCRFCRSGGTRRSPITAMGFDRIDRHIKPWHKRSSTLRKATAG
jgi:RNA-directed DNA polymerase